jgi:hypothetical protein
MRVNTQDIHSSCPVERVTSIEHNILPRIAEEFTAPVQEQRNFVKARDLSRLSESSNAYKPSTNGVAMVSGAQRARVLL